MTPRPLADALLSAWKLAQETATAYDQDPDSDEDHSTTRSEWMAANVVLDAAHVAWCKSDEERDWLVFWCGRHDVVVATPGTVRYVALGWLARASVAHGKFDSTVRVSAISPANSSLALPSFVCGFES